MFVHAEKVNHPVVTLCRVMQVSRSGYYAWCVREPSARAQQDGRLRLKIRAFYKQSRCTYGAPRLLEDLREDGERVSQKRVARLMREDGLQGLCARRRARTTRPVKKHALTDRIQRDFSALAPNRVWSADTTYLPRGAGFVFLVVVLDLFSRRVVGWSLGNRLDRRLACRALEKAIALREPPSGLVFHSDRGSEFVNKDVHRLLLAHRALQSVGAAGDCYDNAASESFFATLKRELGITYGRKFDSEAQTWRALADYIDPFYNRKRRHSLNANASPVDCEAAIRDRRPAA